jgi:hypothetical protein
MGFISALSWLVPVLLCYPYFGSLNVLSGSSYRLAGFQTFWVPTFCPSYGLDVLIDRGAADP